MVVLFNMKYRPLSIVRYCSRKEERKTTQAGTTAPHIEKKATMVPSTVKLLYQQMKKALVTSPLILPYKMFTMLLFLSERFWANKPCKPTIHECTADASSMSLYKMEKCLNPSVKKLFL